MHLSVKKKNNRNSCPKKRYGKKRGLAIQKIRSIDLLENPYMIHFLFEIFSRSGNQTNDLKKGSNGIVLLLVKRRIRKMTIAFQLAVFALIVTSSILLISVPVVFASPEGWSSNKNIVFSGTSLWIGLVFLVSILNSLIS